MQRKRKLDSILEGPPRKKHRVTQNYVYLVWSSEDYNDDCYIHSTYAQYTNRSVDAVFAHIDKANEHAMSLFRTQEIKAIEYDNQFIIDNVLDQEKYPSFEDRDTIIKRVEKQCATYDETVDKLFDQVGNWSRRELNIEESVPVRVRTHVWVEKKRVL